MLVFLILLQSGMAHSKELETIIFQRPFNDSGFNYSWISSKYGERTIDNGDGTSRTDFHYGIDYKVKEVWASYDGVVVFSKHVPGYGNLVKIDHGVIEGKHVVSWYAHLNEFLVLKGFTVKTGDPIGVAGDTGTARGAHLHFEIRENNRPVHPGSYIVPEKFK